MLVGVMNKKKQKYLKLRCENCDHLNLLTFDAIDYYMILNKVICRECGQPAYWTNYFSNVAELLLSFLERRSNPKYLKPFIPHLFGPKHGRKKAHSKSL